MSEVSASTPKRQAIVERLKQRIDSFRKHHDNCQARLEETQPSRELKQRQESQILHKEFMENIKTKANAKLRHNQVGKIPKQEGISSVGQEKSASNTGLQSTMKRRSEFSPSQIDGERSLQSNEDLVAPVPQKYPRFEGRNGVHCKVKASNFTGDGDPLPLQNTLAFPAVNGHNGDFSNSEEQTKPVSSYSGSTCENIDRTITRSAQQYGNDFTSSTFTNRGQSSVSDNSRTADFPVNFKQENDLVSPGNDGSASITNGFPAACTKSEDNFDRLLTDYSNPKSKDEHLKSQLSEFERVFQGIKNRDGNSSDCESKNETTATNKPPLQPQNQSLGNGLNDSVSHDVGKSSNQLALSDGPNNATQLATAAATPSTHQHGTISRSTAQAVEQFIRQQQEEKLTKVRFEKNLLFNSQGVSRDQNPTRMAQRPNHFPVRQRVYEQIQQRRTSQQKSKIPGLQTPQLQARNPVMNPLGPNSPYQMHASNVRYPNLPHTTGQPVTFSPTGRIQQNIMPQIPHSTVQQPQTQGQMQNMPRHQVNMYAQQKMAFQQQLAGRLPSYSQTQHIPRSSSMLDIRQKFSAGAHTSHSAQYPLRQQVTRTPQPLPHLQHYPNAYSNQTGPPSRPIQAGFSGEYSSYHNPYAYNVNQDNKRHTGYQRHSSMDESLAATRFHNQDINNRNNFSYQRSSSLPGHNGGAKNVFNQTSPPVVRLGQVKPSLPDVNNNANERQSQELSHIHPSPQHLPLTHMKQQHPTNSLSMSQEQIYQGSLLAQSRSQTNDSLQQTFSNSFTNLLDLKSSSESSLFPFLGQDVNAGSTESTDFDSLLKSPPADFNLVLNILESEPQKAL